MDNVITAENEPTSTPNLAPLYRLRDIAGEFLTDIADAYEARQSGEPLGATTGLAALDALLNRRLAHGLHIINGNSGAGKTALMLQIAQDSQVPTLFISCEMPPVEILRRVIARQCGKFLNKLKDGTMTCERAKELLTQAIANVPRLYILDATYLPVTPQDMIDRMEIIKAQHSDQKHFLLAIDSLQTYTQVMAQDSTVSEYEALNAAIRALQEVAHTIKQPILLTSERNRASAKSGGKNAGAGTRKIEFQAETVLSLGTDEFNDSAPQPYNPRNKAIHLEVAKNRHGMEVKGYWLEFNGAMQAFTELEVPERAQELGGDAQ